MCGTSATAPSSAATANGSIRRSRRSQEANARRVKQFSDEYFELAETHGRRLSQYLVFDEPVLLTLDNQAYLIEP